MKYLIISRPGAPLLRDVTADGLEKGMQMLEGAMGKGIIEGAYTLVSGGSVWIVNADSHETLARSLRKLKLVGTHQVEVHPILDTKDVIEAYAAQRRKEE